MNTLTEDNSAIDLRAPAVRLSRVPSLRALAALFVLSLRQQIRGWRMIVVGVLFLLPGGLAMIEYASTPGVTAGKLDMWIVYMFIPHALTPLAALLCAGGIIRDDVEEQTLTYLLLRPLPRPALYAIKLLAATIISIVLTVFFSVATLVLIDRLLGKPGDTALFDKALHVAAIFSVTQAAYCGLFGIMGLLMRRSLVIGVAYIIIFEGILASYNTLARQLTVMYYFRVLALRWLNPAEAKVWEIKAATAPTAANCVLTLLIAALVFTVIGAWIVAGREFRMKTPEGE